MRRDATRQYVTAIEYVSVARSSVLFNECACIVKCNRAVLDASLSLSPAAHNRCTLLGVAVLSAVRDSNWFQIRVGQLQAVIFYDAA